MNVSVSWLKNYVDIPVDSETLAHDLTMLGLNVERSIACGVSEDSVVVGHVLEVTPHPNADRLRLCRVDVGATEPLGIVCGATNVAAGQFVPVATIGAKLPNGLKIRKSKIRGETSEGMICSEIELGLGNDAAGIMVLEGDFTPGAPASGVLGSSDVILELEVTPNRPDQLSHVGVAREVASLYKQDLRLPYREVECGQDKNEDLSIEIDDPNDCYRYVGRIVRGVKVGPSPDWLRNALERVGINSINSIVDIANYVMMETGQPLHAFDLAKLDNARVGVRRARKGEKVTALDEIRYDLDDGHLVITADDSPVAIAGVIGGLDSAVTEDTVDLLLESAAFNFRVVRKTRKSLNLSTDASYRFERGCDRDVCRAASDRACELILDIAGGSAGVVVDAYPSPADPTTVRIRRSNTKRILGLDISTDEIAGLLERLHFEVIERVDETVAVQVPSFRIDVFEEADLIEEVARLYGYEHIGKGWSFRTTTYAKLDVFDKFIGALSNHLASRGFTEFVTSSFTDGSEVDLAGWDEDDRRRRQIPIKNPMTLNQSFLRTSLLPGVSEAIRRNFDYGSRKIDVFSVGKVFLTSSDQSGLPNERTMLAIARTKPAGHDFWDCSKKATDLFDIKAEIESLAALENIDIAGKLAYDFESETGRFYYRGRDGVVVEGGVVPPRLAAKIDLDQAVWYALVDLEALFQLRAGKSRMSSLPEYPVSKRDLSLVMPSGVTYGEIQKSLVKHGGQLLESIGVFDVYQGKNIPAGAMAFGVRLFFRAHERTLTDGEVEKILGKVVHKLGSELGVTLRS